jgi:hypothetical protein
MVQTAVGDKANRIVIFPNPDGATLVVAFEWPDGQPGSAPNPPGAFASQETFPRVPGAEVGGLVQTALGDGCVGIVAETNLDGTYSMAVNWPAGVPGGIAAGVKAIPTEIAAARVAKGTRAAPPRPLKILCVHGVGHHEADPKQEQAWRNAIARCLSEREVVRLLEIEFVAYDDLFAADPITPADIAEALLKLAASGLVHGVGDLVSGLFRKRRGFSDLTDILRWTAGMVVQWTENGRLRADCRQRVVEHVKKFKPDVVLAHSLGSLISYNALAWPANEHLLEDCLFVSFGSQIGNPFVRSSVAFNGRIEPLKKAMHWFHLFNRHDDVFTAQIRVPADNFTEVQTPFDDPGILDHDATSYLTHMNAVSTVWRCAAEAGVPPVRAFTGRPKQVTAMENAFAIARAKPKRRALLVGINNYPDPANRLEGCVNDVFLMSSVLQECRFAAEDIRVVLDERATSTAVLERLEWLLDGAEDSKDRVFYYSGHGAQIPGYGVGEKVDHDDECLVTYDFDWKREHAFTDDQFYDLYSQLPYGASFLTIFDCCHSGGLSRDGALRARGINPPDDIRHRLLQWDVKHKMWQARTEDVDALKSMRMAEGLAQKERRRFFGKSGITRRLGCASELRREMDAGFDERCKELGHHGPFMPVILKACQENEYAYEYRHGVISHGAFTYSLAQTFRDKRNRGISWNKLVEEVASTLKGLGYAQKPAAEGPGKVLAKPIPWTKRHPARKRRK